MLNVSIEYFMKIAARVKHWHLQNHGHQHGAIMEKETTAGVRRHNGFIGLN
jgi:hypothetical protein